MTRWELAARNRINAAKSTGPRTSRGKAKTALNATRHGATAKPDPDGVLTRLRIILNRPDLRPQDVVVGDDCSRCALTLAEAETRLFSAETALRKLEEDALSRHEEHQSATVSEVVTASGADLVKTMKTDGRGEGVVADTVTIFEYFTEAPETRRRNQLRLRRRYLAEARARRRKAFDAWIAILEGRRKAAPPTQNAKNPKTKPDAT